MTPTEVDEHRAKDLCFFYHEKFTPGHNYSQRQKGQVFLMEVMESEVGQENESVLVTTEEVTKEEP